MAKPLIAIIAMSARPYAQMASKAGFAVLAFDAFNDDDLIAVADATYQIPIKNNALDADALIALLSALDLSELQGICYGAGEDNPTLIKAIAQFAPVIGNTAASLSHCNNIQAFTQFCDKVGAQYPPIAKVLPRSAADYLIKQAASSGGAGIQWARADDALAEGAYYQQFQSGMPVSCTFISHANGVQMLGFNEQWCAASSQAPFQYGGAVSHIDLPDGVKAQIEAFVERATQHFSLRGLNSCDAILDGEQLYFLEINARLSATAACYCDNENRLFLHHVNACLGEALPKIEIPKDSHAHQVQYAQYACSIIGAGWPDWVSDRPAAKTQIAANAPICTVHASADNSEQAKQLVQTRANSVF